MANKNVLLEPVVLLVACAVVGVLAAMGQFTSIMNFPLVFGLVCLFFGLLSLRKHRSQAFVPRLVIVLAAAALAAGGWLAQARLVNQRMEDAEKLAFVELGGRPAPALGGRLSPVNTDAAVLREAASLESKATIVTFWARWCSPCWTELPELEELYRQQKDNGLAVVAVTRYDQPDDPQARARELAKNRAAFVDRGLTLPAGIAEDDAIHRAYRVRSMPSTALVDSDGTVVAYGVGIDGSREVMRRAAEMLGEIETPDSITASPGSSLDIGRRHPPR